MALISQPAKLLSLHKVPLYCVVPRPHIGQCLNNPTHFHTVVLATVAAVGHTVCISVTVSLPGACLWPLCINVKLSLFLLYTAVIIIILLIFLFSIIFSYYLVILLCHFALCSSWLCCVFTHSAPCPTYHLYSVLLYNLCCLPKGFPKMEKKIEKGLSRIDYVLLYFMWRCKMVKKKKTPILNCERFKMWKK